MKNSDFAIANMKNKITLYHYCMLISVRLLIMTTTIILLLYALWIIISCDFKSLYETYKKI